MFKILKKDAGSRARLGVLETLHGEVETPGYVVVGTHAKVRELSPQDLIKTKTQLVIANTYHLWQTLGDEGLKNYSGLHKNMEWNRPLMTDSGGFQVFSLGFARELGAGKIATRNWPLATSDKNLVRITDGGVYFNVGGREEYLDAQKSIWIQERLGADVILAFDEPTSPLHNYKYNQEALARTHRWALKCLRAKASKQLLYGIVQGGLFENLRRESAKFIGSLDFDGIAIGGSFGSSFGGEGRSFRELDWVVPHLPENKPRHLLGIGLVEDLFIGVSKGIDTFDCVVPTREGRHGNLYTSQGEINIQRGAYRDDPNPLDPECACEVCAGTCGEPGRTKKTSRGELRALFKNKNREAGYLTSFHNVYFFNNLMAQIRQAIAEGRFGELMARRLSARA